MESFEFSGEEKAGVLRRWLVRPTLPCCFALDPGLSFSVFHCGVFPLSALASIASLGASTVSVPFGEVSSALCCCRHTLECCCRHSQAQPDGRQYDGRATDVTADVVVDDDDDEEDDDVDDDDDDDEADGRTALQQ